MIPVIKILQGTGNEGSHNTNHFQEAKSYLSTNRPWSQSKEMFSVHWLFLFISRFRILRYVKDATLSAVILFW